MAKRKMSKGLLTVYKTLQRKQNVHPFCMLIPIVVSFCFVLFTTKIHDKTLHTMDILKQNKKQTTMKLYPPWCPYGYTCLNKLMMRNNEALSRFV